MRTFETGATRDSAEGKPRYGGFLSPQVLHRFGQYMQVHQVQADGNTRSSDNWQKGMPTEEYFESLWRHFMDVWFHQRDMPELARDGLEEALCACLFNVQGLLFEALNGRTDTETVEDLPFDVPAPPPDDRPCLLDGRQSCRGVKGCLCDKTIEDLHIGTVVKEPLSGGIELPAGVTVERLVGDHIYHCEHDGEMDFGNADFQITYRSGAPYGDWRRTWVKDTHVAFLWAIQYVTTGDRTVNP